MRGQTARDVRTSHGAYVSCVVDAVNDLVAAGRLSNAEAAALKKAAANSNVGH